MGRVTDEEDEIGRTDTRDEGRSCVLEFETTDSITAANFLGEELGDPLTNSAEFEICT